MQLLDRVSALVKEPPPAYAFELSEGGIASAHAGSTAFRELPAGTLSVSPVRDNVQNTEDFSRVVSALYPSPSARRRRAAALILPDYSTRLQVLDFDSFPARHEDRLQLIRFRVRKTIPFDVESASISYHPQPVANGKVDVVTAIVSLEILARYEAPFRNAGYHTGFVTTSSLAALTLVPQDGVTVLAKLSGRALTVVVQDRTRLKLIRCLELERGDDDEILAVLHPTVAYVEDELNTSPTRLVLCGFGSRMAELQPAWGEALNLPVEPAQAALGVPGPFNAGLLGFLQDGGSIQ